MGTPKHILVVEDEEHLATGIKYNLEAEGYRVTTVGDGPSALRFVEMNPDRVNLVILDLMLPGMSGYAVCEALRDSDRHMPIMILSSRTLAEDRARGFDVGADQYMMKPFDLDEFLSRVKNLLRMHERRFQAPTKQPERPTSLQFGNGKVDFDTYQATVGGATVRLTKLEVQLLRYFAEHAGRVIPRTELLEQVWGVPGDVNTRAPDQFIRRLRKLFEPDPAEPRYFLTVRDAGYRFVAGGEPQ